MEFSTKLIQLRNQAGLTQEQLAEKLFVSRVTISKWESGRGYPSIESLKLIAKTFDVTIDNLLTNEQIINIAEKQNLANKKNMNSLIFGLLDFLSILLFVLPLFANRTDEYIYAVNLINLTNVRIYMKVAFCVIVGVLSLFGVLQLAFQFVQCKIWERSKSYISIFLSIISILCFILSLQPYTAFFLSMLLTVKIVMLLKVSRM